MTLDEIVRRNGLRFPRKSALVFNDDVCTWKDLDTRVDRVANALLASDFASGARVAVMLANRPEFVEAYLGIARAGLIAVPVSYRLTPRELGEILGVADPVLLITETAFAGSVDAIEPPLPHLAERWVVGAARAPGAGNDTVRDYDSVLAAAAEDPAVSPASDTDTFAIFFTSGTTGLPKGAMVSHLNLEANGYNQFVADESRRDDVNLVGTPLYHMGAVFMAITYMMLGCTQVILDHFEPEGWLATAEKQKATVALLVPTMLNAVLNHPDVDRRDLSSLRLVFYGGGPMPPAVLRRALERLSCGFTQGYGLTETLEATFLVASDHVLGGDEVQDRRLASAGREAVGAEVRIVDDEARDLDAGEVGEVLIRSRSVISGYWNNPEDTAQAVREGWFFTGDLGYLDRDRYLFVVDRKKDMVVSGGVNIYTKEIESVLYAHAAVLEAAIIGLPDEEWGEVVTAAVVLRDGMSATAEELVDHCRASLASYKKPRRVFFLPELPKNPSGKILKRELRQALAVS